MAAPSFNPANFERRLNIASQNLTDPGYMAVISHDEFQQAVTKECRQLRTELYASGLDEPATRKLLFNIEDVEKKALAAYTARDAQTVTGQMQRLTIAPIQARSPFQQQLDASLRKAGVTAYSYREGRANQYIAQDKASCTPCAVAAAEAFLKNPNLQVLDMDEVLTKGIRIKQETPLNIGTEINEMIDRFPRLASDFYLDETSPMAFSGKDGMTTYQNITRALHARATDKTAVAVFLKNPQTCMIAADLRTPNRPQYYIFDSHGVQVWGADEKAYTSSGAVLITLNSQQDLARALTLLYPSTGAYEGQDAYEMQFIYTSDRQPTTPPPAPPPALSGIAGWFSGWFSK